MKEFHFVFQNELFDTRLKPLIDELHELVREGVNNSGVKSKRDKTSRGEQAVLYFGHCWKQGRSDISEASGNIIIIFK
jgi:hypothetical protein